MNPPLVLVKSLITGEWNNDNSDNPTKLSIFFIGSNDQTKDDNHLRLSLRLSEGKGLTEEAMPALMKKEDYDPFENFELHEKVWITSVFIGCFVVQGVTHEEIKRVLNVFQKRDMQIRRDLTQDRMHGARIVGSMDALLHLLLEECENTDSPKEFRISYFSCMELVKQIERGRVNCSLPKALINSNPIGNKRNQHHGVLEPKRPKPVEKTRVFNTKMEVEV